MKRISCIRKFVFVFGKRKCKSWWGLFPSSLLPPSCPPACDVPQSHSPALFPSPTSPPSVQACGQGRTLSRSPPCPQRLPPCRAHSRCSMGVYERDSLPLASGRSGISLRMETVHAQFPGHPRVFRTVWDPGNRPVCLLQEQAWERSSFRGWEAPAWLVLQGSMIVAHVCRDSPANRCFSHPLFHAGK